MRRSLEMSLVCLAIVGVLLMGTGCAAETQRKAVLPEKAAAALKAAFPDAKIEEVELEKEKGLDVYEAELEQGKAEMEVEVTADGVILEVETELAAKDLPKPVADAIAKAAEGATIKECGKVEVRAEIRVVDGAAKVVPLAAPKTVYEADLVKDGKTGEIAVDPDGKVVEPVQWREKGQKDDEGDEDD